MLTNEGVRVHPPEQARSQDQAERAVGRGRHVNELTRKAAAEFVGTAFLVAAVIGSGIMATRLSPNDVGLQLLQNSLITGAALVALILALQPVSAAFNPVVTLVERVVGLISNRDAATLVVAQLAGGSLGAIVAILMCDLYADSIATTERTAATCGSTRS